MSDLEPRLADLLRRAAPPPPTALDEGRRLAIQADARQTWFRNRSRRRWALISSGIAALLVAGLAGWTIRSLIDEPRSGEQPVATAVSPPAQVSMPVLSERQDVAKAETAANGKLAKAKQDDTPAVAVADGVAFSATAGEADALAASAPMAAAADQRAEAEPAPASPASASAPVVATRGTRERVPAEVGMEAKRQAPTAPPAAAAPAPAKPMAAAMASEAPPARIAIPANAPRYGQLLLARAVLEAAETWPPDERRQALRTARDLIARIDHPSARELRQRLDTALGQ